LFGAEPAFPFGLVDLGLVVVALSRHAVVALASDCEVDGSSRLSCSSVALYKPIIAVLASRRPKASLPLLAEGWREAEIDLL
jgi:hypothetical protein